jgi:hypothetical protein
MKVAENYSKNSAKEFKKSGEIKGFALRIQIICPYFANTKSNPKNGTL